MFISKEEIEYIESSGYVIKEDGNIYRNKKKVKKNINNNKYSVSLNVDGWIKVFYLSHIIASKFLSAPPDDFKFMRYRDTNYRNTKLENLFWSDGRYSLKFKKKNSDSLIFNSTKQAASYFNVSVITIYAWITNGKTSYKFGYEVEKIVNHKIK